MYMSAKYYILTEISNIIAFNCWHNTPHSPIIVLLPGISLIVISDWLI